MFIDTHCHLNFKAFNKDLDDVIRRAKNVGVGKIIIPGAKLDSSLKAIEIAQSYDNCFASVGIHPHHAQELNASLIRINEALLFLNNKLNALAQNKKVVAIGEIGLDYFHYKNHPPILMETKNMQKELLLLQLTIASKLSLPVIIHCREAQKDLIDLIESFTLQHKVRGVFHCFDGEKNYLKKVLGMGFYIGFDGNITYPENNHLLSLIKSTPIERILLETDSPYLTPIPFRGAQNEPANLKYTALKVAEIYNKTLPEISEITSGNATDLFNL